MGKPRITVYIPSHNYGRFLGEAIESVLRQSVGDWELFLIDDGSTDNTSAVMKLYEGHPKIRLFFTGGIGLTAVCNLALAHAGGDWRDVVTRIRRSVPEIWPRLSPADRRRFLRHLRPYWDIHRHRCPARVVAQLESLKERGILRIHAGRLDHLRRAGDGIEVGFRPRGSGGIETLRVDRVFNCTGPDYDLARVGGALWRSLLTRGLVAQDTLGLGIDTDGDARVLSADGSAVPNLYCFGPLRRARLWEATAISELREQAAARVRGTAKA